MLHVKAYVLRKRSYDYTRLFNVMMKLCNADSSIVCINTEAYATEDHTIHALRLFIRTMSRIILGHYVSKFYSCWDIYKRAQQAT